ncbi:hypothetical protein Ancab_028800 [Ancistrocladus abbreviatus]
MEFGVVGFDGLAGSNSVLCSPSLDYETKQKGSGSGSFRQERSEITEDDLRPSKAAKASDFLTSTTLLLHSKNLPPKSVYSDGQQQQHMLKFSCPKPEASLLGNNGGLVDRSLDTSTFPYFNQLPTSYSKNQGLSSGMYFLNAVRGPLTPSQWLELEHQALIYKYIIANEPIPPNLLIPIRRAIETAGFCGFTGSPHRPNTLGWGPFHLGFANSTDPEPGRCRRTDGKKWRCTRDAVPDQKYCERHMNRGRHRSRKHVEGQAGHSVGGATSTTTTTKLMPAASSSSASVVGGGGTPNRLNLSQQVKNWQLGASNSSASVLINRMLVNKESNCQGMQENTQLSSLSPNVNLSSTENSFFVPKLKMPYGESAPVKFGIPSSERLLNASCKGFPLCGNYASSHVLGDPESVVRHSLHPFMDEWHKIQGDQWGIVCPELATQSDRTQLSIANPMAPLDFMSSTSSPINEKGTLSPMKLSREINSIKMDLRVGTDLNEPNPRQANWNPISWETSSGGPLGEVLNSTSSCSGDSKKTSALNLLSNGWKGSPQFTLSSPTRVLQMTAFGSLSNSSAGSSPCVESIKEL